MYIPRSYQMSVPDEVVQFIQTYSFGILFTQHEGKPVATHLPFYYDAKENVLLAHMARANSQCQTLNKKTGLVVFSGPHTYISPSWYEIPASVPTWNYTAVHVVGTCTIVQSEEELAAILDKSVQFYEPASELSTHADEPFYRNMMKGIVGFRIEITGMEGQAKLSQNKSVEIQQRIISKLSASPDANAQEVAQLMQERQLKKV